MQEITYRENIQDSKEYKEIYVKEIRNIIDEGSEKCEALLNENMAKLHVVAQKLIEKEKIDGEEFESLFNSI